MSHEPLLAHGAYAIGAPRRGMRRSSFCIPDSGTPALVPEEALAVRRAATLVSHPHEGRPTAGAFAVVGLPERARAARACHRQLTYATRRCRCNRTLALLVSRLRPFRVEGPKRLLLLGVLIPKLTRLHEVA